MPPPQTPASFSLHSLNHNVVSNTLFCRLQLSAYTQQQVFQQATVSGV